MSVASSEGAAERTFSILKCVYTHLRNRLGQQLIEAEQFVAFNTHATNPKKQVSEEKDPLMNLSPIALPKMQVVWKVGSMWNFFASIRDTDDKALGPKFRVTFLARYAGNPGRSGGYIKSVNRKSLRVLIVCGTSEFDLDLAHMVHHDVQKCAN